MQNQTEENQPEQPFARRYSSQERRRYLTKNLWTDIIFWMILIVIMASLVYGVVTLIKWMSRETELSHIPAAKKTSSKFGDLIEYEGNDNASLKLWSDSIEEQIKEYLKPPSKNDCKYVDCSQKKKGEGEQCLFDKKSLGSCNAANYYGYGRKSPCIMLNLLKIKSDWQPQFYNQSKDLPEDMPVYLKERIKYSEENGRDANIIWISCEPALTTTMEEIGAISFFPEMGFNGYYYPQNNDCSIPPLVALNFERPQNDKVINVRCRVWAKNLKTSVAFRFRVSK